MKSFKKITVWFCLVTLIFGLGVAMAAQKDKPASMTSIVEAYAPIAMKAPMPRVTIPAQQKIMLKVCITIPGMNDTPVIVFPEWKDL